MTARLRGAGSLLVLLACASCAQPTPEEVVSEGVVPVWTEPAATGSIRASVHATGLVSPAPGADLIIVAPEGARIADLPYGEGDAVSKGGVLVRFEIPGAAAELERQVAEVRRAEAAIANARANQNRAGELFDRGVAARKDVEDADRQMADAQAALEQAAASRTAANTVAGRSLVRAPFDGLVAKRYHNPGDLVEASAGDPVLRFIDPLRFEVVASVPLADASRVVPGSPGHLVGESAGRPYPGLKVVSRPAAVAMGTATVPVRLAFDGPVELPAGTPVEVDIEAEIHADVVLVPNAAIVREGEDTFVFVVTGGSAERRLVRTALSDGERVEILSGVTAGDEVIVEGHAGLPDGAAVTVATASGATNPAVAGKEP
jgi:RND family efflux transporter MFP subunit